MWTNPQKITNLYTFTEGILNVKIHFLCSVFQKTKAVLEEYLKLNG